MNNQPIFENVHSFVVKVWIEEIDPESGEKFTWRASITHVPSGNQKYLKNLEEILTFIRIYTTEAWSEYFNRLEE